MPPKTLHCWALKSEWAEETYGRFSEEHLEAMDGFDLCLLEEGHAGEHEWTSGGDIEVKFTGTEPS